MDLEIAYAKCSGQFDFYLHIKKNNQNQFYFDEAFNLPSIHDAYKQQQKS